MPRQIENGSCKAVPTSASPTGQAQRSGPTDQRAKKGKQWPILWGKQASRLAATSDTIAGDTRNHEHSKML